MVGVAAKEVEREVATMVATAAVVRGEAVMVVARAGATAVATVDAMESVVLEAMAN